MATLSPGLNWQRAVFLNANKYALLLVIQLRAIFGRHLAKEPVLYSISMVPSKTQPVFTMKKQLHSCRVPGRL